MPKISVIIPIYGAEAYVEKCVRSVMDQTLREIEILCVDDASPDNSAAIVERLAAEDGRVRLIRHTRNLGAGGARNTGLEAARAPYVTGVDSDDYILPEMLEKLWEGTGGDAADVVVCGLTPVDETGQPAGPSTSPPPGRLINTDDQIDIFAQFNPSFCNKLWRRTLFTDTGVRFPEHLYYEDLATTPRLLRHARDIRVIAGDYYQYVLRNGSRTHSASAKHILDYFRVYDILGGFLKQEGLQSRYEAEFTTQIGKMLAYHASGVIKSDMPDDEKSQYLRHMLLLKIGFLAHNDALLELDARALQRLLLNATGADDLPPPPGTSAGGS